MVTEIHSERDFEREVVEKKKGLLYLPARRHGVDIVR